MTLLNDPVFWVSIATLVVGAYRFSLSQMYRSKCSNFQLCWGLVDIKRDVVVEQHIDERAMQVDGDEETKEPI